MIGASALAQRVVLAFKHFGKDPYALYNESARVQYCPDCRRRREPSADDLLFCEHDHEPVAWRLSDLPPHPRPLLYRAFLLAAAKWCDDEEMEKFAVQIGSKAVTGLVR